VDLSAPGRGKAQHPWNRGKGGKNGEEKHKKEGENKGMPKKILVQVSVKRGCGKKKERAQIVAQAKKREVFKKEVVNKAQSHNIV